MSFAEVAEQARSVNVKTSSLNGIHRTNSSKRISNSNNHQMSGGGNTMGSLSIGTKPTLMTVTPMRFLIMDAPRQGNLHVYIKEMRKHHVTDVVRVCEPTYDSSELRSAGINLHEMEYKDGTSPSKDLIENWLEVVEKAFYSSNNNTSSGGEGNAAAACIAVHCVAGLGRAPVMVAIAMIEFLNMDPVEAVTMIRKKRRGAINEKQLLYLESYKKQYKRSGGADSACCVIF